MNLRRLLWCLLIAGCSPAGQGEQPAGARTGLVGIPAPATKASTRGQGGPDDEALLAVRRPKPKPPTVPARSELLAQGPCRAEQARVQKLAALPGTPGLDRQRAEMVARAKGEPVIFVRAPEAAPTKSKIVRAYRRALDTTRFPWDTLERIQDQFQSTPRTARQVVLKDGYFYAGTADLGYSLWEKIRLEQLFDEPALVIERGSLRMRVVLNDKRRYLHQDGPEKGRSARLLLFDRIWVEGEEPGPALHRDVRTLSHELGFDRMKVERLTEDRILAQLRYGDAWVPSVIATEGPRMRLLCELPAERDVPRLAGIKSKLAVQGRVLGALREQMLAAVDEELPFDEPKTEWGQQDGHLRRHWLEAYAKGQEGFDFQGDHYSVFGPTGRPLAPQVCVDFVTETLERASGTGFRPRGSPPGRDIGGLDFDGLIQGNRRQMTTFIQHAKSRPEQFEFELLPTRKQIPYVFKHEFYRHLEREADRYRPGTIVVIRGFAPWDHYNVPHYHAFFVYEADPVTGMPMLLAGNAGKPRIQSWEPVMNRAPQRSINYRIVPNLDWLAEAVPDAGNLRADPPPLVAMF